MNKKTNQMNKKAVSISIILLVLSTLILSVLSLYYFYIKDKNVDMVITSSNQLDEIYYKKDLLDFYLGDIFDKASFDFISEQGKVVFIDNFKKELNNYKDKKGDYPIEELRQVESQMIEENVELDENELVLRLELKLKNEYLTKSDYFAVNYDYKRNFEKVFK